MYLPSMMYLLGCMIVVGNLAAIVSATEPHMKIDYDNADDSLNSDGNSIRLQEIQNRILDIVGNTSIEVHTLTEVMGLLHSDSGQEIGKLFIEGFGLGLQQKNSGHILGQFLSQLQGRLSPELQESFNDYRDFFKGLDITTLPLVWEQLFKKDELGNSLAGMPLGQLVDLVQPTASKYGIDIKLMMNSLMGKGDNNVKDLLLAVLTNADLSSLVNQIINTTTNAFQTSDTDRNSDNKIQNEDTSKKSKTDKTLRLFRPLLASLLKENEIDLDADAVLEVLAPIFKSDIIAQASPFIAMLAGQGAQGGLGSMIANLMGGGGDGFNPQQMAGLLGGLGSLMAAGGNNQMDMGSILSMASMFMGKPSKKKNDKNRSNKKMKEKNGNDFDLSSLMNVAGQLVGDNINLDTILDFASRSLLPEENKKKAPSTKNSDKKASSTKQKNTKNAKQESFNNKNSKKTKTILEIIEPILRSMKNDKKCNSKIKDAINMGKTLLKNKFSSLGNLEQILPMLISFIADSDSLKSQGVKLETLVSSFSKSFSEADWAEFLVSLENKDFREVLIRNIAPNAAEVVSLLATKDTQTNAYEAIVPLVQRFLASYGMVGVTLDNFPERLAPMLGLLGKGWNLPFNPTTVLVPLKMYLKGLQSWISNGLEEIRSLSSSEMEKRVIEVLEEDVCDSLLKVVKATRMTTPDPYCLPQRLCQVNSDLQPDSLKAAVTRATSLIFASGPVLETPDSILLLQTIQAISGRTEECEVTFPGDCSSTEEEDDDASAMDLQYDHQEL